ACLHQFEASAIATDAEADISTPMAENATAAPVLFDRALLVRRIARAKRLGPATFLLDRVAEDMAERLAAVNRAFTELADIWTPGEGLSLPGIKAGHIDIGSGDETLSLALASLDLVVSALAFQFVNDLPGVLAQIRRALKPDGLLLAALVGGDTLTELRQSFSAAAAECVGGVSPRGAPAAGPLQGGLLLASRG